MDIEKNTADLVVVGAGPGGYAAAFRAADLGMAVTLVDSEPNPGGVCLFKGCIPSKALLHVARLLGEAQEAHEWGIDFGEARVDAAKLRAWKQSVVMKLTGGLGQLAKQRKIRYVQGQANFIDSKTLRIIKKSTGEEHLSFKHCILATGSRPASLPDWPLHSGRLINSTGALELEEVPQTLLVIGGGYIGLELGTVYSALGSRVTVVEMADGLLPGADRDLVLPLSRRLEKQFAAIHLKTKVAQITEAGNKLQAKLSGPKGEITETFDKVLYAIGRKPNSSGIGLDLAGVKIDAKGFVTVDEARRTNIPHIFAIGDVAGEPMLAHKAAHEARVAVEALAGEMVAFEPRCIPAVVFTDPEIAWCGLTEDEAKKAGRAYEVARFPWAASGRAMTLGRTEGLTKLVIEPETELILGVGICGPGAGDMIAEGALAIEMGSTAKDLALTIHAHPTLSETLMESAEVFFGQSAHLYRPKKGNKKEG